MRWPANDRDVLAQPAVTHVIVMEGINDIGQARERASPSAADLIAGTDSSSERALCAPDQDLRRDVDAVEGQLWDTEQVRRSARRSISGSDQPDVRTP